MSSNESCNHGDIKKINFISAALTLLQMVNKDQCFIDLIVQAFEGVECTEEEKIAGIIMFFSLSTESRKERAMLLAIILSEYEEHPVKGMGSLYFKVKEVEKEMKSRAFGESAKFVDELLGLKPDKFDMN